MNVKAEVRRGVLRVFKFLYLLLLIVFLTWSFRDYVLTFRGYRGLWSGEQRLNLFSCSLCSPAVILECRIGDSKLFVRLLRTYAEPEAEDLRVVVEFEFVGGGSMRVEVRKRTVLGGFVSLEFPIGSGAEQMASYRVEVYLDGRLVAVGQGG